MKISLDQLGWNDFFQSQLNSLSLPGSYLPARVSAENRTNYKVITEEGEMIAEVPGKFLYAAGSGSELPKVGDWVIVTRMDEDRVMIHHVLNRAGMISRKSSGKSPAEQIIAANIDVLFIVLSLDNNFNMARMERYLSSISGNVAPVILLNKADLCSDVDVKVEQVTKRLTGIQVVVVSALNNETGSDRKSVV